MSSAKYEWTAAAAMIVSSTAGASGFALLEQNATDLGKANAGTGVASENAAGQFNNPASMAFSQDGNIALVGTGINDTTSFQNSTSQPAFGQALGNSGGDVGHTHFVPADYMSKKLNDKWAVGLAINSPFGLSLDYKGQDIARYQALHSSVKAINLNPSIAFRVTTTVALGLGVSYQKIESELTSQVNYSAIIAGVLPSLVQSNLIQASSVPSIIAGTAGLSGVSDIRGDDHKMGFNVGLLYQTDNEAWKVGAAYRSGFNYSIRGTASFTAPVTPNPVGALVIQSVRGAGASLADGSVSLALNLPASALVSSRFAINDSWHIYSDILWTQWSKVQQLNILRENGTLLSTTPEAWKDTWRAAIGEEVQVNTHWMLRAGVAYDQTPVPNSTRNPRLPDNARQWLSLGARWAVSEKYSVDAAYVYINENGASIHSDGGNSALYGVIEGTQHTQVNIVSVQLNAKF